MDNAANTDTAQTAAAITDHNSFCERYEIVSTTGRCYGRSMLLGTATRRPLFRALGVSRAAVAGVIDDDAWLLGRRGQIPASVADDAIFEAFSRGLD